MKLILLGLVVLLSSAFFLTSTVNAIVQFGKCNDQMQYKQNLQVSSLVGLWYQVATYRTYLERGVCASINVTLSSDGSMLNIAESHYRGGRKEYFNLTASPNATAPAKMIVSYQVPQRRDQFETVQFRIQVVDTDYISYLLVWSCENSRTALYSNEMAWLYVRTLDEASHYQMRTKVWDRLEDFGMRRTYFQETRQTMCDYQELE